MTFLNGCEAIAHGAWEAGAAFVGSYPGSPVTGVVETLLRFPEIKTQWMANEKIALEAAIGVAHAGQRALAVMKHVGLNVAADPFFNVAYTGVRGGLVIVVGDDPGAKSSQNEQDTRLLAAAAHVPILTPSNVTEALLYSRLAFDISEEFDVPVVVRVTTEICYSTARTVVGARRRVVPKLGFAGPIEKYLLLPVFVPDRHKALNNAIERLRLSHWSRWFNHLIEPDDRRHHYPYGIIVSGYPANAILEIFQGLVPILKVGINYPLNEAAIREFARRCERILVVEESSRFLKQQIKALGITVARRPHFDGVGTFALEHIESPDIPEIAQRVRERVPKRLSLLSDIPVCSVNAVESNDKALPVPPRPPGFCAGCSHRGIFYTLSKRRLYVVGDIGCYTLGSIEPYQALHTNLCMGASIGLLQGYIAAMGNEAARSAIAVIGDSTFFHSGIPPLLSAVAAKTPATILILDNSGTAMTGFQMTNRHFGREDWECLLRGLGVPQFSVIDALDLSQIETSLDAFLVSEQLSVLVLKGDCVQALPKKGPTNYRYTVQTDMCTQCGECLKVDCPAIVPIWGVDSKTLTGVTISNECIGCGLCSQSCDARAIVPRTIAFKSARLTRLLAPVPWHAVIRRLRSITPIRKVFERFEREMY